MNVYFKYVFINKINKIFQSLISIVSVDVTKQRDVVFPTLFLSLERFILRNVLKITYKCQSLI